MEGSALGTMGGNYQDSEFSSFMEEPSNSCIVDRSTERARRLYVINPRTALPTRHAFPRFSDEETGSERGSDLAKSCRSEEG